MDYEVVIGLEVHVQLLTESKMFCSCSADYQDAPPNTLICPVCMGMPGVLPVINKRAVEYVIKTGLALNCAIAEHSKFDRKNYPYPDLMKGYQISQYDLPIATNGSLVIETADGQERTVKIRRVHLEEDVAKLLHRDGEDSEGYSLMDINRSGAPLMEVVSDPDMRSPEEARSYLTRLRSILQYIGVSTANMEEGSFRCDANISVRPAGETRLGPKVEVKNLNSFRFVYRALQYEAERQIRALSEGERIVQETRGWVEERGVTVTQRVKEGASDYRYFPEPDLPPLVIGRQWVQEVRESLPELPQARKARFVQQYGLPAYDAGLLTASKATADIFEAAVGVKPLSGEPQKQLAKSVSNWMLGELARLLNATGKDISEIKIQPRHFVELVEMIDAGALSSSMAKTVFEEMFNTGRPPRQIAEEKGLAQISDEAAIQSAVDEAIAKNPQPVSDYLSGKETATRFLVGQVMKLTRGKANPQLVSKLLRDKLETMR
jgi:aspartyl-tRNA(Asn)/glutamyl-tRNA(Gln) amidotransferase subunit B